MEHIHTFRHCQQMTRAHAVTPKAGSWQFPTLWESNYAVMNIKSSKVFLSFCLWNSIAAKIPLLMSLSHFHLSYHLTTPELLSPLGTKWMLPTRQSFILALFLGPFRLWSTLQSTDLFVTDVDTWLVYKKNQICVSLPRSTWSCLWMHEQCHHSPWVEHLLWCHHQLALLFLPVSLQEAYSSVPCVLKFHRNMFYGES